MHISDVLASKGSEVATLSPETPLPDLVELLASKRIGAVVVTDPGGGIAGIASERDVVRRLHALGADLVSATVAEIMTADVQTCGPADPIDAVLQVMTRGKFRHLPVVADGRLAGIVSIGDLVKVRIDELQVERDHLEAYISG